MWPNGHCSKEDELTDQVGLETTLGDYGVTSMYMVKYYRLFLSEIQVGDKGRQPVWSPNREERMLFETRAAAQAVIDEFKDGNKTMRMAVIVSVG